jgi:hypothetical protein
MGKEKSGLSIQTLAISALASVAAAVITATFWQKGTLIATAMTPVIVSVVSEALRRPAEVIKVRTTTTRRGGGPVRFEPLPPGEREAAPAMRSDDPFGLRAPARSRVRMRHHWKLAVATGLAAFAVAAVALTGSELVFGGPATSDNGRTTLFGGRSSRNDATPTPTATPTETKTPEEEEATPTATPTPTVSPTATPTATPVPAQPPQTAAPTITPTPTP